MEKSKVTSFAENEDFLPIDYTGLTPKLKHIAEQELNECEENIHAGIKELKELIKEEELQTCSSDDFLIMFLRAKKYNTKRAFHHLKEYSYQRHILMNYYGFMFPDKIMPMIRAGIVGFLPKRDAKGRAIIYFRANKFSSSLHGQSDDVLRAVQVIGHYILMFPATQVSGLTVISDARFQSMEAVQLMFKYLKWILPNLHTFPGRFQKVDCINTNICFRALASLIRPLMPLKVFKRISFHGSDLSGLLKTYDKSILPEEFGGNLGSIDEILEKHLPKIEDFISVIQATNVYFEREDTIKYPKIDRPISGFFS